MMASLWEKIKYGKRSDAYKSVFSNNHNHCYLLVLLEKKVCISWLNIYKSWSIIEPMFLKEQTLMKLHIHLNVEFLSTGTL